MHTLHYMFLVPCGTKFLRVLIFAIIATIRTEKKFPQNKYPAKIRTRKNLLHGQNDTHRHLKENLFAAIC